MNVNHKKVVENMPRNDEKNSFGGLCYKSTSVNAVIKYY